MSEFDRAGFTGGQLQALNVYRHYKDVVHLSDLYHCDGMTLDPFILTNKHGLTRLTLNLPGLESDSTSTGLTFPYECLLVSDSELWVRAIQRITSAKFKPPHPLGPYLCHHNHHSSWYVSTAQDPSAQ